MALRRTRLRSLTPAEASAKRARKASRAEVRAAIEALYAGTPLEEPAPPPVGPALRIVPVTVSAAPREVGPAIEKGPQLVSERYLAAVREMPCCLCPAGPRSHAHHVIRRSRRQTRNDLSAIAVCPGCHADVHEGRIPPEREQRAVAETQALLFEQRGALWWLAVMREIQAGLVA